MKKSSTLWILVFGLSVFFVSCSNFFNGAVLKQALEDQIDYANAPYAKIRIRYDPEATLTCIPVAGDYDDKYKAGNAFSLSYTPKKDYDFIKWTVMPEGAVVFADETALETTAEIVNVSEQIVIEPYSEKRIEVIASFPLLTSGSVDRNTSIHIYFNEPMSEKSIYWTADDLKEVARSLGYLVDDKSNQYTSTDGKTIFYYQGNNADVQNKTDENGNPLYWKYYIQDKSTHLSSAYLKNIDIVNKDTGISLNNYYYCPKFISETELEIPVYVSPSDKTFKLPSNTNIKYSISNFESKNGTKYKEIFTQSYKTNGIFDVEGPTVTYIGTTNTYLSNVSAKKGNHFEDRDWNLAKEALENISTTDIEAMTLAELNSYNIKDTKSIKIEDDITIRDAGVGYSNLDLVLTPVKNALYPDQLISPENVIRLSLYDNTGVTYGSSAGTALTIEYDLSNLQVEGVFKVTVFAVDKAGNETELYIGSNHAAYIIVDNIFQQTPKLEWSPILSSTDISVTGPKGTYLYLEYKKIGRAPNDTDILSAFHISTSLVRTYSTDISNRRLTKTPYKSGVNSYCYLVVEDEFGNIVIDYL